MTEISTLQDSKDNFIHDANKQQYAMLRLGPQLFGLPVEKIEDILSPCTIYPIPLAPEDIKGSINLRGRIVTVIDLTKKLEIKDAKESSTYRNVIIESKGYLYGLLVDQVSEVINIPEAKIANNPENLSEKWKEVSSGVYSLKEELMVILDPDKLLDVARDKDDEKNEQDL